MSAAQWQRPAMAAASMLASGARVSFRIGPSARPLAPVLLDISGRRHASVKMQGVYRLKPKRTVPKKLGAKKSGGQHVIPGNIIFKQRGTIWWPGENCIMGRDHTIHAAEEGFVQFYRDPTLHPDRKYIGVVFDKADRLPYPRDAERRRRLNMVAVPRREREPESELTESGIPRQVVQVAAFRRNPRKPRAQPRVLRVRDDYSYREDNWRIGLLGKREVKTWGRGRSAGFRKHRLKKLRELEAQEKGEKTRAERLAREEEERVAAEKAARERAERRARENAARLAKQAKKAGGTASATV